MSADSNIEIARVRIDQPRHHHLAGPTHECVAAGLALRHVVQPVRDLERAQLLAHDAAERRGLEAPQLERLLGRHAALVEDAEARAPQARELRRQIGERAEREQQRHVAVAVALEQVLHDRVGLVHLDVRVRDRPGTGTAPCRRAASPLRGSAARSSDTGTRPLRGRAPRAPRAPCGSTDSPRTRRAGAAARGARRAVRPKRRARSGPRVTKNELATSRMRFTAARRRRR